MSKQPIFKYFGLYLAIAALLILIFRDRLGISLDPRSTSYRLHQNPHILWMLVVLLVLGRILCERGTTLERLMKLCIFQGCLFCAALVSLLFYEPTLGSVIVMASSTLSVALKLQYDDLKAKIVGEVVKSDVKGAWF